MKSGERKKEMKKARKFFLKRLKIKEKKKIIVKRSRISSKIIMAYVNKNDKTSLK